MGKENTSDLVSYVQSNKEIISSDNYNEVDGLIFAEMSYSKFENLYNDSAKQASYNTNLYQYTQCETVSEYARKIVENTYVSDDEREFYIAISESPRYMNCKMHDFAASYTDETQWAAFTVDIGENTSVVAMRGTDGTSLGWEEDLELLIDVDGTDAQNCSYDYLKLCNSENIYLTGHSKGGNDCIAAYIMSEEDVRNRVSRIDNYDGPGFNDGMMARYTDGYLELGGKLNNYYPKDSLIGLMLNNNPGNSKFLDSEVREGNKKFGIIGEHDPFSFQIGNNQFEEVEQSEVSVFLDETLDEVIDKLTYTERIEVFNLLVKAGLPYMIAGEMDEFLANIKEEGYENYIDYLSNTFLELSELERAMTVTAAVKILSTAFGNIGEYTAEKVLDEVAGTVESTYYKIRDKVREMSEKLANTVTEVYNKVTDILGTIKEKAVEYFGNITDKIKAGIFGDGYTNTSFDVNLEIISSEAENLRTYAGNLEEISYEIAKVYKSMDYSLKKYCILTLASIEKNTKKKADSCKRLGNALDEAKDTYAGYENSLVGQF